MMALFISQRNKGIMKSFVLALFLLFSGSAAGWAAPAVPGSPDIELGKRSEDSGPGRCCSRYLSDLPYQ